VSQIPHDLPSLAGIIAEWVEYVPGIGAVYLFGSRVRGDHRPDSDVDLRLYIQDWQADRETTAWWTQQDQTEFADLKARLPGPLAIHRERTDDADNAIKTGMANPVLRVGKVVCVWTPPRKALLK
jgi:predicted nucleotidyltransferase